MAYTMGMTRFRDVLTAHAEIADRIVATLEESYAARQRPDGVWIGAAAWLVSARVPVSGF
jgi:hypothetical protein